MSNKKKWQKTSRAERAWRDCVLGKAWRKASGRRFAIMLADADMRMGPGMAEICSRYINIGDAR